MKHVNGKINNNFIVSFVVIPILGEFIINIKNSVKVIRFSYECGKIEKNWTIQYFLITQTYKDYITFYIVLHQFIIKIYSETKYSSILKVRFLKRN